MEYKEQKTQKKRDRTGKWKKIGVGASERHALQTKIRNEAMKLLIDRNRDAFDLILKEVNEDYFEIKRKELEKKAINLLNPVAPTNPDNPTDNIRGSMIW